jgi:hypothetical protein
MFTKLYITANPRVFLDTLWIGISALRVFLDARDHAGSEWSMMVSFPKLPFVLRVKREFDASNESLMALTVKSEAMPGALPCRTRSQMEGGRGVLEISDDDEPPQLGISFMFIFSSQWLIIIFTSAPSARSANWYSI